MKFTLILAGAMLAFHVGAQTNSSQKVTVKVQDFSGQPVAGATVGFYPSAADQTAKPTAQTTGSDGLANVAVEKDGGQLVARKPGMAIDGISYSAGAAQPIVLTLGQSRLISGTVLDESDKPVSGATVTIRYIRFGPDKVRQRTGSLPLDNPELQNYLSAQTGPDGAFRVDNIPTNCTLDVSVKKSGKAFVPPRQDSPSSPNMFRAGQQGIALKMLSAGSVEGKVLIPDPGYDMSRVSLTLAGMQSRNLPAPTAKPSADGSFRFEDVAPGRYRIMSLFGTNALPDWVARSLDVSVEPGKITRDAKVTAEKGGFLEVGVFTTVGRKPMAGVYVAVPDHPNGITGTNGVTFMRARPGTYTVFANNNGDQASQEAVQVEEGKTNRVELLLTEPRQISGIVRDTNGNPVVGARVTSYAWHSGSSVTDSNGFYRVPVGTSDRYGRSPYVLVRDRTRNLAAVRDIEDGTDVYDLQLAPGAILSGRVQDESGKPLPNAKVNTVAWSGNTGWWIESQNPPVTDAQGRFEVNALPVNRRYGLEISAKGYGTASANAVTVDTNRFDFETFTLRLADKKTAGVVVDSEDKPVADASIYVSGTGQPSSSATTDQKGRFVIDEVCEGVVNLSANASVNGNHTYGSVRAEAGDTNIIITLGRDSGPSRSQPRRASLVGKPLPDLTQAGFSPNVLQTNKPLLICLFDPEQRPSRRTIRLLGDQFEALKEKDVTVVGLFATPTATNALNEWKQSNPVPFAVGAVTEKNDATKWILSTEKFPWLILTDPQGRVKAEGFDLEDLDAKLK